MDEELRNFLLYVAGGEPTDEFTASLDREIQLARKNKEWEVEYMTFRMIEQEKYAEGVAQGQMKLLFDLVKKGLLTKEQACEQVEMSSGEFQEALNEYETSTLIHR